MSKISENPKRECPHCLTKREQVDSQRQRRDHRFICCLAGRGQVWGAHNKTSLAQRAMCLQLFGCGGGWLERRHPTLFYGGPPHFSHQSPAGRWGPNDASLLVRQDVNSTGAKRPNGRGKWGCEIQWLSRG